MTGVELIAAERQRQITIEGWTPEHDDEHDAGELSLAARAYASFASSQIRNPDHYNLRGVLAPGGWPWDQSWWKPSPDPIRNLEKAGALIVAEIDRVKRKQGDVE